MGQLINGVWQTDALIATSASGQFQRKESQFRHWVSREAHAEFAAEPNRYHLYISLACPWACRALLFRKLKKLEEVISLSVVDPLMGDNGWEFSDGPGCIPDNINHKQFLYEVYSLADPGYTGRVTVPVLWDKHKNTIVNNESSEIIRMFNSEFNTFGDASVDFYPESLREEIDAINSEVYRSVNNGVYKVGFASTQSAYEAAFDDLFAALDDLELRLSRQRYLVGNQITEADWRLFSTLIRFDVVYVGHFKCNRQRIIDYPNLHGYLCELYQYPGVAETVSFTHIKEHYYRSHRGINPNGIVPKGPEVNYHAPHQRERVV